MSSVKWHDNATLHNSQSHRPCGIAGLDPGIVSPAACSTYYGFLLHFRVACVAAAIHVFIRRRHVLMRRHTHIMLLFERRRCQWTVSHTMGLHLRSAIFCFFPLDHRIHLGPPRSPILCHFHPSCANTLCHCLHPSPHHEPTSVTLRSQLFLKNSATVPYFSASRCDSFHAVDPFLSNAPHDRTTRSNLRGTFHHHTGVCAYPDSCAVILPLSCPLRPVVQQSEQETLCECSHMSSSGSLVILITRWSSAHDVRFLKANAATLTL